MLFMHRMKNLQKSQEEVDEEKHRIYEIEQKLIDNSYIFFCDRIIDSDSNLKEAAIIFDGNTATAYSRVIHVANCAGDIDLIRNVIPNREYLDRLQAHYDHLPPEYLKVSDISKRTRKFVLMPRKRVICELYIFRPIEYRNVYYILYYVLFEKELKILYGISLDDDYQVIDYCTKIYKL